MYYIVLRGYKTRTFQEKNAEKRRTEIYEEKNIYPDRAKESKAAVM